MPAAARSYKYTLMSRARAASLRNAGLKVGCGTARCQRMPPANAHMLDARSKPFTCHLSAADAELMTRQHACPLSVDLPHSSSACWHMPLQLHKAACTCSLQRAVQHKHSPAECVEFLLSGTATGASKRDACAEPRWNIWLAWVPGRSAYCTAASTSAPVTMARRKRATALA